MQWECTTAHVELVPVSITCWVLEEPQSQLLTLPNSDAMLDYCCCHSCDSCGGVPVLYNLW